MGDTLVSIDNFIAFNDVVYDDNAFSWQDFKKHAFNRKIVIIGGGEVCEEFINKYKKKYDIVAIVDNNCKKHGKKLNGINIISFDDIEFINEEFLILIASTKYNEELKKQANSKYNSNIIFSILDMELRTKKYKSLGWLFKIRYNLFSEHGMFRNYFLFHFISFFRLFHLPGIYGENEKRLEVIKNSNCGKRCFIVATGPSLDIKDLDLLKNEVTFGVNAIFKAFDKTSWRPNYYVLLDPVTIPKYEKENNEFDLTDCARDNVFISDKLKKYAVKYDFSKIISIPVCEINNLFKHLLHSSNLLYGHFSAYTVTVFAMNIAEYMGFNEIYLLGVDCNYNGDNHYFDGSVNLEAKNRVRANDIELNQIRGYEMMKKSFDKKGIKVYNASRGGRLEVFKRVDFDSLFKEE